MSSFAVTIEKIEVLPHPGADKLELAKVGEYRAVIPKGAYKTGEWVLYIPEMAVLPPQLIKELGLVGKLAGKESNRVKAIKLRGELSQGIVCRPKGVSMNDLAFSSKYNFAEDLGIVKWVPEVPASMSGEVISAPELVRWPDVEDVKRFPDTFKPGERVVATEKIHGTCCLMTYIPQEGAFYVSSKGVGGKSLAIKESDSNVYWRAIRQYGVLATMEAMAKSYASFSKIALFAEVYGPGIQDLHYGVPQGEIGLRVFSAYALHVDGRYIWPEPYMIEAVMDILQKLGLSTVPVLYDGAYDYDKLCKVATGTETISGKALHVREGIVVRAMEYDASELIQAKFINPDYLTRGGKTTEYE